MTSLRVLITCIEMPYYSIPPSYRKIIQLIIVFQRQNHESIASVSKDTRHTIGKPFVPSPLDFDVIPGS